jgi:hypothetical protein
VRIVVRDDLHRSRLTVAFRAVLAIPHFIWLSLWGGIMAFLLPVQWVALLVTGRPIAGLHEVYGLLVNYTLHVYAYTFLAADPFPAFLGQPGRYPVDAILPEPAEQNRWTVAFRLILVLPPLLLAGALGSGFATTAGTTVSVGAGVAIVVAFLGWFASLARAAMPPGFRDVQVWTLGYAAQVAAYAFLLTDRYPDSDPRAVPLLARPRHPVRMAFEDGHRRQHRLLTGFRLILVTPHMFLAALWGVVALVAAAGGWIAALVTGRIPGPLHRFLARYVRFQAHLAAFLFMACGLFPGFTGRPGGYPLDLEIDAAERQPRAGVAFRALLAIPALMVAGGLGTAQLVAAVGAWFCALVTGRVPRGLQRLVAYTVRYTGQAAAYAFLLTPRYPHSGPSEREPVSWLEAPEAVQPA